MKKKDKTNDLDTDRANQYALPYKILHNQITYIMP